jgi:hydrogenase/urease accessory protein HupE
MFGGLFICICRSVCWDNVIVRRVFGMFEGVLFCFLCKEHQIRVSYVIGFLPFLCDQK